MIMTENNNLEYFTLDSYREVLDKAGLLKSCLMEGHEAEKVLGLTYDSREVKKGTLFICKGAAFKKEYLLSALKEGAFAYVAEESYGVDAPCILVNDIRQAMPPLAEMFYNRAWEKIKISAFGGTKGKSTSAYYMKAIVDDYMAATGGKESAILSSIDDYDGVIRRESHITTPESVELHMHMNNAVSSDISFMEMEVSSQALKYNRVDNMRFDVGVFLNISEDHISPIEHEDFEDYLSSKLRMFALCDHALVNLDADCTGRVLKAAEDAGEYRTFSLKDDRADYYAYDIHKDGAEIVFMLKCRSFERELRLTMPGLFNVENAVASAAAADILGIPSDYIYSGLYRARSSGRMELFRSKDELVTAVVDYAHNKLSFDKLFSSTREEYPQHDIIAIFGCPGYKAYVRRKDLGEIAGRYSSKVYLVAEDPGKEPPQHISEDIAQYVEAAGCPYEIIEDRGAAIYKAIMECRRPSIILITGKGGETRQKYGTTYAPCISDIDYVKRFIDEYDASPHHACDYSEWSGGPRSNDVL